MTDEERRWALADKLRRKGFIVAAYELTKMQIEIERLAADASQLSEENEQLAERNKVLEDTIDRLQERYG